MPLLKKLLCSLVPEGVSGPWTVRFKKAEENTDPEVRYSELLQLILDPHVASEDATEDNCVASAAAVSVPSQPGTMTADSADPSLKPNVSTPPVSYTDEEDPVKIKEAAVYLLGDLCARQESVFLSESATEMNDITLTTSSDKTSTVHPKARAVQLMLEKVRPFFSTLPKAKTAKIVRNFIDMISDIPNVLQIQEQLCLETIRWCREEKRAFLRHRVETRLALLYHQLGKYTQGLEMVEQLLQEVKRLDDKLLLVEIHYIEARLFFSIRNMSKAKAALTASRSNATAIHCPPLLQADIDVMAGAIHCEEGDPKTAFSYFYEAFEAFNVADDPRALPALKYMMLSKLMAQRPQEVSSMATQRAYLKYARRDITAFQNISKSYIERDLDMFKQTLEEYAAELTEDPIISRHTNRLYQTLLEQNILKVLKPFSRIEVNHIARLMKLPIDQIQSKLSEMILDHQLHATLDQGAGVLTLFDEPALPSLYADSLAVFDNLSAAVDLLHQRAQTVL